jgi:hypothetical protein
MYFWGTVHLNIRTGEGDYDHQFFVMEILPEYIIKHCSVRLFILYLFLLQKMFSNKFGDKICFAEMINTLTTTRSYFYYMNC